MDIRIGHPDGNRIEVLWGAKTTDVERAALAAQLAPVVGVERVTVGRYSAQIEIALHVAGAHEVLADVERALGAHDVFRDVRNFSDAEKPASRAESAESPLQPVGETLPPVTG